MGGEAVCYSTNKANLRILGETLLDLDARRHGIDEDLSFVPDERTLARVELRTLDTNLGKLDLMTHPAGGPSYTTLRSHADTYDVGGFVVRAASITDLIAVKQAAGCPKDVADVVELEAIERARGRGP